MDNNCEWDACKDTYLREQTIIPKLHYIPPKKKRTFFIKKKKKKSWTIGWFVFNKLFIPGDGKVNFMILPTVHGRLFWLDSFSYSYNACTYIMYDFICDANETIKLYLLVCISIFVFFLNTYLDYCG